MTDDVTPQEIEPAVDPAIAANPEPVVEAPEPEKAEAPAEQPKPEPKQKTPWFMERINEETNKKREAEERARRAEADAEQLRALLEASQTKPADGEAPKPAVTPRVAPKPTGNEDFDAAVARGVAQAQFARDTQDVLDAGNGEFSDFGETVGIMQAIGMANDDFVQDVLSVDKASAHKIFDRLAKNPEQARQYVRMSSKARIAALTRMIMADEQKPAAPAKPAPKVSSAPPPKQGIDPVAAADESDMGDGVSDEEFSRKWDRKYLKRA